MFRLVHDQSRNASLSRRCCKLTFSCCINIILQKPQHHLRHSSVYTSSSMHGCTQHSLSDTCRLLLQVPPQLLQHILLLPLCMRHMLVAPVQLCP